MPMTCSLCCRADRNAIDAALTSESRDSLRRIASRFGTTDTSLRRHRDKCLSATVTKAAARRERAESKRGTTLLDRAEHLHNRALGLLDRAEQSGDLRTAIAGVREVRGVVELLGRLTGEVAASVAVHQQTVVAVADVGQKEQQDRAWIMNELRQMKERILLAQTAQDAHASEAAHHLTMAPDTQGV